MSEITESWYVQMLNKQKERRKALMLQLSEGKAMAWADALVEQGFELKMTWDGGGDSGWVDFEVDKDNLTEEDNEMIDLLRSYCDEELDYGSWAGEFHANGEAVYDSESKSFKGIDYYSEDDSVKVDCDIEVKVPKDLWFDRIEIMIEDESIDVNTDIIVVNGFKTEAHTEAEKEIDESVSDQVDVIVNNLEGIEYRSMWEEITLPASAFTVKGKHKIARITTLDVGTYNSSEKFIEINLNPEVE